MTENDNSIELEQRAGGSMARSARKFILLVVLVGVALFCLHFTPAKEWLSHIDALKGQFRSFGAWGPAIFFIASVLLTLIGFPRLGMTFIAGVVFGAVLGGLLAVGSTLLGSYMSFLVARWSGAEWARRIAARSRKVEFAMDNQSVSTVFLLRQLPVTNIVMNLLLSLTSVSHRVFLLGSLLGFIPGAAVAAVSGSSLGKSSAMISFFQFGIAVVIVLTAAYTVWRLKRKWSGVDAD